MTGPIANVKIEITGGTSGDVKMLLDALNKLPFFVNVELHATWIRSN